jgi:hypothetical protein
LEEKQFQIHLDKQQAAKEQDKERDNQNDKDKKDKVKSVFVILTV